MLGCKFRPQRFAEDVDTAGTSARRLDLLRRFVHDSDDIMRPLAIDAAALQHHAHMLHRAGHSVGHGRGLAPAALGAIIRVAQAHRKPLH